MTSATWHLDRRLPSFQEYIDGQTRSRLSAEDGTPLYAHPVDEWILRSLNAAPVKAAIEKAVDSLVSLQLGQYLATGIPIDQKSFPDLFDILTQCAQTLDIPVPQAVVNDDADLGIFNAFTAGTDEYSFVCLTSGMSQRFSPEETAFVIGHECGHIASRHMVYHTLAWFLTYLAALRWLRRFGFDYIDAVFMPLLAWSRRSEITADRAGLLCCGDLKVAERGLLHLAAGFADVDRVDVDDYLRRYKEVSEYHGVSRWQQYFASHPFIPRRIEALRLFANSELYCSLTETSPPAEAKLLSRDELNRRVDAMLKP